jgi:hypothetical protein
METSRKWDILVNRSKHVLFGIPKVVMYLDKVQRQRTKGRPLEPIDI